MSKKFQEKVLLFFVNLIICGIIVLVLIPVVWIIGASLKSDNSLFSDSLIPKAISWKNYYQLLFETDFFLWIRNSLIVCTFSTLVALFMTTTAGYAFSRFRFWGRKHGLMLIIIVQMFPAMMAMVAVYYMLSVLDKLTCGVISFNLFGLILIYAGGGIPFNTWLIKGYLDSIPKELEESAYIDGATRWQTFTQIILPLMWPILATIAIFNFIGAYNDFLIPTIVLQDSSQYTLAVGLRSFITGQFSTNWAQFAAGASLGALPILVIFLLLQRFLVEGLTKGALKG